MSGKDLYFECASGISGDMAVAALIDLGADVDELNRVLGSVPCDGFRTEISRVKKNGIDCCDFNVILEEDNHDHDMEYLFGHEHEHNHDHEHGEHHHHHDHEHAHGHDDHDHGEHHHHDHEHSHHHVHRNLSDVMKIIEGTDMSDGAKKLSAEIFDVIADAEAKAHGTTVEQVHFHEVGAVDSIVDIISFAVCFDSLKIRNVYVKSVFEGTGTVRCEHGILPVPVPAVANIVQKAGLPLSIGADKGEFVTPTGAAILAATATHFALPESFSILKTGCGAGKRTYQRPSLLRAMLIEEKSGSPDDTIVKLESNIDDCTGEQLGFTMEELFARGALDVHFVPCFGKKNRPGYVLNVICDEKDRASIEEVIFLHTTTIGIRRQYMERTKLARRQIAVSTLFGEAECKIVKVNGTERAYPEYRSVVELCRKTGESFGTVYSEVMKAGDSALCCG